VEVIASSQPFPVAGSAPSTPPSSTGCGRSWRTLPPPGLGAAGPSVPPPVAGQAAMSLASRPRPIAIPAPRPGTLKRLP